MIEVYIYNKCYEVPDIEDNKEMPEDYYLWLAYNKWLYTYKATRNPEGKKKAYIKMLKTKRKLIKVLNI